MRLDTTLQERTKDVRLRIHQPDATPRCIGDSGPLIEWHLHKPRILRAILKHPGRTLGTSYVRGDWDTDTRLLPQLIQALLPETTGRYRMHGPACMQQLLARLPRPWRPERLPHWYDISASISRTCLGEDRLHSCAWFNEAGMPLEQAQRVQSRRLISKLQLRAGQHILDLSAGWGSLALYLAGQMDVQVTAIVTTPVQLQFAQNEACRRHLDDRVQFRQGGADQCSGRFDRILADGFLERHTKSGLPVVPGRLEELLEDDGLAWLQVTTRSKHADLSNRWLQRQLRRRYSLPLLSGIMGAMETSRLRTVHLEDRSSHWLQTLQVIGQRFGRRRSVISQRFGEPLTRYWEFMLASQETATRMGQLHRYDLLLGNTRTTWPFRGGSGQAFGDSLPLDLGRAMTGLTRYN